MKINTQFIERRIQTLEKSLDLLNKARPDSIEFDMYRSASVKEFEIILEQSGKLLKKILRPFFASSQKVDGLTFKDIFRYAANHGLLTIEEVERWLEYRDNRNSTVHDYGWGFAEKTLKLLPRFISDSKNLVKVINQSSIKNQDD